MSGSIQILSFSALISLLSSFVHGKYVFCYYSSFAQKRKGIGNFQPEDINPHLCTHLIFAFVDITPDGRDLRQFNKNDLGPNGLYARTMAVREKNPALKVLLAVGGWRIGSKPFLPMISNEDNTKAWIENVVVYLRKHGFDGLDMDWEFPATRGSPPEDKYRFTQLMKDLYEAFANDAAESGKDKLLLTLATASGTYYINPSYEPYEIIKHIDYMFLMTYNYHGQWENKTGHHSGLHRHPNDPTTGEKAELYQQWSIDYWLDVGMPKDRMVVGIPTYGMSFTLADESDHGVHVPVTGGGEMGEYTVEKGILAYYEICINLRDKGWHSAWIDEQFVPYAYNGNQWVGYDDQKSIVFKAENIMSRDLAGAFVWSVEMDDFKGVCSQGEYPLLSTIQRLIGETAITSAAAAEQPRIQQELAIDMKFETENPLDDYDATGSTPKPKANRKRIRKVKRILKLKKSQNASTGDPEYEDHQPLSHKRVIKKLRNTWRLQSNTKDDNASALEPKIIMNQWSDMDSSVSEGIVNADGNQSSPDIQTSVVPEGPRELQETETSISLVGEELVNICNTLGVGIFPSLASCEHFILCGPGDWNEIAPLVMECPSGTKFDNSLKICNYAKRVDCNN